MSNASVLFDAPGPRARALSRTLSVITALLVAGGLLWMFLVLNAPKESGGITLPGMFDESRWDIFADPEVWQLHRLEGVVGTRCGRRSSPSVLAVALGVVLSLLRSARNLVDPDPDGRRSSSSSAACRCCS